jgi:hypothetical protein
MKRCLKIFHLIALSQILIIGAALSPSSQIGAQRLSRPPSQETGAEGAASEKTEGEASQRLTRAPVIDLTASVVIPAGANSIPEGTKLIVELESRLSSKESKAGDRFRTRTSTPVVDEEGRTLVPAGTIIEGSIVDVQPAKRRRRSGVIQLTFENMRLENDRLIPIRGRPTNAEEDDQNRFDDEGNVKTPSTKKGALKIAGASAGAGIAIGAAAGGALAGAGIGAVAGLTIALLMKGSDVVIEPGHLFALELIQPLRLSESPDPPPARTILRPSVTRNRPTAEPPPSRVEPTREKDASEVAVDVSDVRSERTPDGMLMILVTAKTPGAGWRIFADHTVSGDQVEVDLRGVPPPSTKAGRISHPTAPTISIPDNDGLIKKVIVRGKNGPRENKVRPYPGSRTAAAAKRPAAPDRASSPAPPVSKNGSAAISSARVEREIEELRNEFGTSIGMRINPDGSYEATGGKKPTSDQKQLLDALGSQLNSVQAYIRNAANPATRRNSALLVEEDVKLVEQVRMRVKMSSDMNKRFRTALENTQTLIDNDLGGSQPAPASPTASSKPSSGRPSTSPASDSSASNSPASNSPANDSPAGNPSEMAAEVIGEITQCQYDFGATIGVWINPDGTSDLLGERKPTADEQQILDGLTAMLGSAKAIDGSAGASANRDGANKFLKDAAKVEQAWKRVKMSPDLNQKFTRLFKDSRSLAETASR